MKTLRIQPRGVVKSGFITFDIKEDGHLDYEVEVKVKILFMTKTYGKKGSVVLPVKSIKSSSFEVGAVIDLGILKATVMSGAGKIVNVNLDMPGIGSGHGIFDLSDAIVSIQSIDVKGSYAGISIEIVAS